MNIQEVIKYSKLNKSVTIPELQTEFGVPYRKAKSAVDKLIADGKLAYESGIKYNYVGNFGDLHEADFKGREVTGSRLLERIASIEMRRKELKRRLRRLRPTDCDNDEDDEDEEEADGNALRRDALKVCIERNYASVSLLQRIFPIGYIRACELIDWMEERGFIAPSADGKPHEVLITPEEFDILFNGTD
ncbi:MAG: hypothetical protein K2K04_00315 [Clostridia bacterium]|nr:hypothetical protein [Clostridia bacterium]